VAVSVVTLPKIVVKPKISSCGLWVAMKIVMLSSVNQEMAFTISRMATTVTFYSLSEQIKH